MSDVTYVFSPFDFGEIMRTKEEAETLVDMIDKILDSFFNAKETPNQKMKELLPYHIYFYIEKLAGKQGVLLDDKPMLKNFLTQVKAALENMPVVTIELAFWPTETMLNNMSNYLSIYLKRTILFDIVVNKEILAGAKLSYNGKYKDLSIQKRVDELVKKEAQELISSL